ncbi:MAG: N-acetylglucosamine-6-phosphate deacetylase [Bacteroidota bacterium]
MSIPGFIDLQVNGYYGVDYCSLSLTEEQFIRSCLALKQKGVVGFLPTIVTASEEIYKHSLGIIRRCVDTDQRIRNMVLGVHLEGPFLSPVDGARGAHPLEFIKKPDLDLFDRLMEWSGDLLRLLTIAADQPGADELCQYATQQGVRVSLGHHLANYEQILELRKHGASGLTHLGNANPHLVDRHKNPIISGLAAQELCAMMITDGFHIPEELIRLILNSRPAHGVCVVSDASPFAGMPSGNYETIGLNVTLSESGRLFNPQTGYLVGSSFSMLECMNYVHSLGLLSETELEMIGFANPLAYLGISTSLFENEEVLSYSKTSGFTVR